MKLKPNEKGVDVWYRYLYWLFVRNEVIILKEFKKFFGNERVDSTLYSKEHIEFFRRILGQYPSNFNYKGIYGVTPIGDKKYNTVRLWCQYLRETFKKEFVKVFYDVMTSIRIMVSGYKPNNWIGCTSIDTTKYVKEVMFFIHYPKVTIVQNENPENKETIYNAFACVSSFLGRLADPNVSTIKNQIGLSMIKTTFTERQFHSSHGIYVHSHVPSSLCGLELKKFCTGNYPVTPINCCVRDISNFVLRNVWITSSYARLFAEKLDVIMRVESLAGKPYFAMGNINSSSNKLIDYRFNTKCGAEECCDENIEAKKMFNKIKELHLFKFGATNRKMVELLSPKVDVVLTMSKLINKFVPNVLLSDATIKDNNFYTVGVSSKRSTIDFEGRYFIFNDKKFEFEIMPDESNGVNARVVRETSIIYEYTKCILSLAFKYIFQSTRKK